MAKKKSKRWSEETHDGKKLTIKQVLFREAYLTNPNAAEAARAAGYSEKSAKAMGHENLTKPYMQESIKRRVAEVAMDADEVLSRLSYIARGDIAALIKVHGGTAFELDLLDERGDTKAATRLIRRMTQKIQTTKDGDTIATHTLDIHDPLASLKMLGQYHKLFTDKSEFQVAVTMEGYEALLQMVYAKIGEKAEKAEKVDAPLDDVPKPRDDSPQELAALYGDDDDD